MHTQRAVHATFVFPVQACELPRPVRCRDSSTHLCADVAGSPCVLVSHALCAHAGAASGPLSP